MKQSMRNLRRISQNLTQHLAELSGIIGLGDGSTKAVWLIIDQDREKLANGD